MAVIALHQNTTPLRHRSLLAFSLVLATSANRTAEDIAIQSGLILLSTGYMVVKSIVSVIGAS